MYTTNNICVSKTDVQLGEDGEVCWWGICVKMRHVERVDSWDYWPWTFCEENLKTPQGLCAMLVYVEIGADPSRVPFFRLSPLLT